MSSIFCDSQICVLCNSDEGLQKSHALSLSFLISLFEFGKLKDCATLMSFPRCPYDEHLGRLCTLGPARPEKSCWYILIINAEKRFRGVGCWMFHNLTNKEKKPLSFVITEINEKQDFCFQDCISPHGHSIFHLLEQSDSSVCAPNSLLIFCFSYDHLLK